MPLPLIPIAVGIGVTLLIEACSNDGGRGRRGDAASGDVGEPPDDTSETYVPEELPDSGSLADNNNTQDIRDADDSAIQPDCSAGTEERCAPEGTDDKNCGNKVCTEDGVWSDCEKIDFGTDKNGNPMYCGSPCGEVGTGECRIVGKYFFDVKSLSLLCKYPASQKPAVEACDGKDNDCNGVTDDPYAETAGYENFLGKICSEGIGNCETGGIFVCADTQDGTVCNAVPKTAGPKTCIAGDDADCNGLPDADEINAAKIPCDNGGMGGCFADGVFACFAGYDQPVCSAPKISPTDEICDGLDNDCDGTPDDGFGKISCGVGECAVTVEECKDGKPQTCAPKPKGKEVCNGLDDDCNGTADFVDGVGDICKTEICDGKDNDNDNLVDEGFALGASCYAMVGDCLLEGISACDSENPTKTKCDASLIDHTEICDEQDNDCNGATDDAAGVGEACDNGLLGACFESGVLACTAQNTEPSCNAKSKQPGTEACNGVDDDCDGGTDENLGVKTCGIGACEHEIPKCSGGKPTTCNPTSNGSSSEICDGNDNDCDGATDEIEGPKSIYFSFGAIATDVISGKTGAEMINLGGSFGFFAAATPPAGVIATCYHSGMTGECSDNATLPAFSCAAALKKDFALPDSSYAVWQLLNGENDVIGTLVFSDTGYGADPYRYGMELYAGTCSYFYDKISCPKS